MIDSSNHLIESFFFKASEMRQEVIVVEQPSLGL